MTYTFQWRDCILESRLLSTFSPRSTRYLAQYMPRSRHYIRFEMSVSMADMNVIDIGVCQNKFMQHPLARPSFSQPPRASSLQRFSLYRSPFFLLLLLCIGTIAVGCRRSHMQKARRRNARGKWHLHRHDPMAAFRHAIAGRSGSFPSESAAE